MKYRRRRFRAGLALTGKTMRGWAAENGVCYGHLYQVLRNARESKVLSAKIDGFIESVEASAKKRANAA